MRRMTRGLALLTTLLATLAAALPATAAEGRTLKGVLVSVTASSVSVKDARDVVTTCAIGAKSPSTDGLSPGDRVQARCVRARGRLVLAQVRRLAQRIGATSNDAEPTKFGGVVSSLGDASITVRDGDHDLTCSLGAASPSTAAVKVGQHVKVSCSNGVLVGITVAAAPPDKPKGHTGAGTISAVSDSSVTFRSGEHDVTCSLAAASPSLAGYHVGDKVKFGCLNGTLVAITKPDSGVVDGAHKTIGAAGAVTAVSPTSLTVHTDGGSVTCTVGDGSPSVASLHVGDKVKIGCLDGVLKVLVTSGGAAGTDKGHAVTTVSGTLTALSASSVTVHGEHGDVTCTVPATAHLGDFHTGDRVGMACADGALVKLIKL